MPDTFPAALQTWQTFYFMVGGAAASLTGLMFVSLSLGTTLANSKFEGNYKSFVTPSILYFVTALLICALMLTPMTTPAIAGATLLVGGGIGLAAALLHVRRLITIARAAQDFNLEDWLSQVIVPVVSYLLLLGVAFAFLLNAWNLALIGLCVATLLLMMAAIANTWSLVVWIIENR